MPTIELLSQIKTLQYEITVLNKVIQDFRDERDYYKTYSEDFQQDIKLLQDENALLKLNLNMSEDLGRVLTEKVKSLEAELKVRDSRVKLWERKYKKLEKELKAMRCEKAVKRFVDGMKKVEGVLDRLELI